MENVLVGIGVILGGLFCFWVIKSYLPRIKQVKTMVTVFLMIAALPMGVRLAMERTRVFTQAYGEPEIISVQFISKSNNLGMAYVTLSEASYVYGQYDAGDGQSKPIFSNGTVETRIGHSMTIDNYKVGGKLTLAVNGGAETKVFEIK